LADIFVTRTAKRFALGLIPHWSQVGHSVWSAITAQRRHIKLINPISGYERVINEIAQCDAISSSSLHGLILADALGVPNLWVIFGDKSTLKDADVRFKFMDYYASTERDHFEPTKITPSTSALSLARMAWERDRADARHIQAQVLNSFPL